MMTRIGHVMIGKIHTGILVLIHLLAVTLETPTTCRIAPVATILENTSNCTLGEKVKKSDNVMPYPVSY